ncbi:ABC transporter related protein (plasmid) [Emticicia oligotrophica DSM 17448]|uniref:ABC transporter related protein n=1 Tax=Emticicia oligotrophica (strain DSM 17448 / CIP 109782 / MTCC 6937 / GPTSA100-15) TaxID=929562 RepID=A0ABN4ATD7_EMTOG|nr:peptidase domain-containing ABC transporter [Emticicia oligotrophica]AFK05510.1 ABC transporter related protein [Emticicia oligotrophica DSM 17448]
MPFTHFQQQDAMDCGPTCLRMVAKHYGRGFSIQKLREATQIGKEGVSLLGISEAAESIGFKTLAVKVPFKQLEKDAPLPCIVHWKQNHFVVVYQIKKNQVYVADPALGLIKYSYVEFESQWATTIVEGEKTGIALLLESTQRFYQETDEQTKGINLSMLSGYVFKYKRLILQLFLGLFIGSILQLILPFLTQSVVDTGIQTRNLHFIYLVLAAQLMLFIGRMSVEFIRSWILLHISTRINLSILSDFLGKLLRLPVSFFESKKTGDILQRIGDHQRIESFLTGTSLNVLFSMFNLIIFSVVLAYYNLTIFGVFLISSIVYSVWIVLFLRYRRKLDNKRFALASQNQSSLIQLVQSVPELKLNNAEIKKRWEWENLQVKNFHLSVKGLALQQYQQTGAMIINEGKNIVISFLAATAVVNGQMTLGAMMALQYIIGQLNSPVEQLIQFMQHYQDAQISLERLNEIHEIDDEETTQNPLLHILPENQDIQLKNLTFTYTGAGNEPVLKNINLTIPQGKITAIVGTSGSGKTTLLKLLLKFYKPQSGEIRFGNVSLENISHKLWRSKCGTVMQEGVIFSDTIAENIAFSDEFPDTKKLLHAVKVANIQSFIEELPLSYNTKIGAEGNGISQGQKQRMLIARAVYKNPDFIFFDEATNALDANNESIIMANLDEFFKNRTVIVVAHRLSTVKNADQIVVMEKGEIVEVGTHAELTQRHGKYFELVKNQLELGN